MAKSIEEKLEAFKDKLEKANLTESQRKDVLEQADRAKTDEDIGTLYKIVSTHEKANNAKTAQAPTPSPKKRELDPANDIDDFSDFIRSDAKAQKFMMIYMLAHEGLTQQDFAEELKRRQFLADFEAWKQAGEPGVSMPKLPKHDIKFPTALYRLQDRTTDIMYVYYSDGTEEGIKYIPKYEQIENPLTGEMEDSKIKTGETESYDMKFEPRKAEQLIETYNKLAPPGTKPLALHYWIGDNKQTISVKNFLSKSHDEIVEMFNNKKPLN